MQVGDQWFLGRTICIVTLSLQPQVTIHISLCPNSYLCNRVINACLGTRRLSVTIHFVCLFLNKSDQSFPYLYGVKKTKLKCFHIVTYLSACCSMKFISCRCVSLGSLIYKSHPPLHTTFPDEHYSICSLSFGRDFRFSFSLMNSRLFYVASSLLGRRP